MAGACICFSVLVFSCFLFLFSMHYVIVFSLGDPRGFRFSGGFELIEVRVFLLLKWLPPTAILVLRGPQPSIVSLPVPDQQGTFQMVFDSKVSFTPL